MIKGMERGDTVSSSAYPRDLTVYKGKLYFIHQPAKSRREIWVSDGSSDGTVKANYIFLTKNWPHGLMVLREKLYFFVKEDFPVVYALIEYDGARSGSTLVKNFPYEGYDESFAPGPLTLTVLHDKMFFTATVDGRYKLWVTDGTSDGTHVVKDNIYTGAVNPAPCYRGQVVEFDDRLFLPARDSPDLPQEKLWATDGSEAGTEMVPVGTPSTDFLSLEVCNGRLYFTIVDSQSQKIELWSTDATADGTVRIDGPAILLPGNLDVSLHCYDQTL
jgi:ELWxxDGT repeat protein